jgi:hypothetical protein
MNTTTFLLSLAIIIIFYPFSIYFKLKSLSKKLICHQKRIEDLVKEYKISNKEEVLGNLDRERRAYNAFVRANNHKLDSILGKFIANKYGFEKKEHFEFKA